MALKFDEKTGRVELPLGVFTETEMADLLEIGIWFEPDRDDGLFLANEDYIERRALWSFAYGTEYEYNERVHEITKPCPACNGDGWIEVDHPDGYEITDCDTCDTSGRVEIDCKHCDTAGRVEVDIDTIRNMPEYKKALSEVEDDLYKAWRNAAENTFEKFFGYIGLDVIAEEHRVWTWKDEGKRRKFSKNRCYRLEPQAGKTWEKVAEALAELISGVGYFWFDNAKELKDSYPYRTYKEAVIGHLHWVKDYNRVYGEGRGPEQVYSDNLGHYMQNW